MKICSNCGAQNHDEDMFCAQCGASLAAPQADAVSSDADPARAYDDSAIQPEQTTQQDFNQQYGGDPAYAYAPQQPQNPYPLLQTLKEKGSCALFLAAIICMTVQAIISFVGMFGDHTADLNEVYALFDELGIDSSAIAPYLSSAGAGNIVGSLISMIPTILILIGLWMIYINCRKKGNEPLATTGFSLVRGVTIFQFVMCIIAVVLCVILFMAGFAMGAYLYSQAGGFMNASYTVGDPYSDFGAYFAGFMVGFVVALIAVAVIGIIYFVKVLGSLKRAKEIIVTGSTQKNISGFVGVLQIIIGVLNIISGLITGLEWATILSGVTSLLFGILIMDVKKAFAPNLPVK